MKLAEIIADTNAQKPSREDLINRLVAEYKQGNLTHRQVGEALGLLENRGFAEGSWHSSSSG